MPADMEMITGATLLRLDGPDLKRPKAEQDAMVAKMDAESTKATDQVAAATTQPEVKAAAVTTQAVATQAVAAAPPEVKAEAQAAQTQVTQAQAKVDAATTPAAVASAKEEVKVATDNVAKVVDKIQAQSGGEGSFFDWFKKSTIISAAPNFTVVCGAAGIAAIAYWYFTRKVAKVVGAVTVAG
jgi:type II secretory pathway component HofQ